MPPDIRRITADDTLALRQAVLRPGQPLHELIWPGDRDPQSYHAGAFMTSGGQTARLLGVASIYAQPLEDAESRGLSTLGRADAWRLRGMATHPSARGLGLGAELLLACLAYTQQQGATVVWCNARANVAGFYQKYGFTIHGEPFELPRIGPHYLMSRPSRSQP